MLSQDLRYAAPAARRATRASRVVALLTLALGIGANTAIFSVIDTVLLRPAPVRGHRSLAVVWETDRNTSTTREPASLPDFLDYQQRSQRVEQIAAFMRQRGELRARAAASRSGCRRSTSTHELLPMLGVQPLAGRGFTAEEAQAGGPAVVVISEGSGRARSAAIRRSSAGRSGSTIGAFTVIGDHAARRRLRRASRFCRPPTTRARSPIAARARRSMSGCRCRPRRSRCRARRIPIFMVGAAARQRGAGAGRAAAIAADLERAYPGERGARRLRRAAGGGRLRAGPARAARAARRRRPRAARRLRERRQPAARARHRAAPGGRRAHGARRERLAADAPVRRRRAAAGDRRGGRSAPALAVARRPARSWRSRRPTFRASPTPPSTCACWRSRSSSRSAAGLAFGMVPGRSRRGASICRASLKGEGGHGGSAGGERTRLRPRSSSRSARWP